MKKKIIYKTAMNTGRLLNAKMPKPCRLKGFEFLKPFTHKAAEGPGFRCSEGVTGHILGYGHTRSAAIKHAMKRLDAETEVSIFRALYRAKKATKGFKIE